MDDFLQLFDQFFLTGIFRPFLGFLEHKRLVLTKMKQAVLERSVASIFEDLDRLPQADREKYTANNKTLLEGVMEDHKSIDFARFDIDRVVEEERHLVRVLRERDLAWFSHFRD